MEVTDGASPVVGGDDVSAAGFVQSEGSYDGDSGKEQNQVETIGIIRR